MALYLSDNLVTSKSKLSCVEKTHTVVSGLKNPLADITWRVL